jgi:uncharacterized membrane protein YfcA
MLSDHAIPDWIYEPLPYAYGAFGSISAYQFDHQLGQLAGVLMIAAGLIVWFMRRQYRRAEKRKSSLHSIKRKPKGIQLRHYRD